MKRYGNILTIVAASGLLSVSAQATIVTNLFTHRENVNVLNSYAASLTALQQAVVPGLDVNNLRSSWLEGTFWDGGANPAGGTNSITINFNATRNIKSLNVDHFAGSEATAYTVETSPDGIAWTTQSATYTPSGDQGQLVLASAVNAQYLRLTATAINDSNGTDRWILNALRVFGDTGSFEDTSRTIDRVSSTGGPGGGSVTLSLDVGSVSITDATTAEYVNDALYPIKRQVLYSMGTGDGFTLYFDGDPIRFERVGLYFAPGGIGGTTFNAADTFTIGISTNGTSFTTVHTQAGGLVEGMNYFSLATTNTGQYLRFTWASAAGADNRIGDIQVFGMQAIPEPSTMLLLGAGGLLVWRFRGWRRVSR